MAVLYVASQGASLRLDSGRLVVRKEEQTLAVAHLPLVDAVALVGRVNVTTPLVLRLLRRGVVVSCLGRDGRFRGRFAPPLLESVFPRLGQATCLANPVARLLLARSVVARKIEAMIDVLERFAGNHPSRVDRSILQKLAAHRDSLDRCQGLDALRGMEGAAAAAYFKAFGDMTPPTLPFPGRTGRGARDPINALLNFAYALLVNEAIAAIEAASLDPWCGFYHEPRTGRPSLALDLIEPYRHVVADRFVLTLLNKRRIRPDMFHQTSRGARLRDAACRRCIESYEQAMFGRAPAWLARNKDICLREALWRTCERLAGFMRRAWERQRKGQAPLGRSEEAA